MGVARLLAKGWIVLCLYAGAHEIHALIFAGVDPFETVVRIGLSTILFAAMGLLFIAGFGASRGMSTQLTVNYFMPHYTDIVFVLFAILSFINQTEVAPHNVTSGIADEIESAIAFAVPAQKALVRALEPCALDGGRIFSSAIAWVFAFVLFGSSLSRLRLASGILRLERNRRPEPLGAGTVALLFGVAAVIGIQLLFVGSAFNFIPCDVYTTISGLVLIGLGPLFLVYVIIAAVTALLATGTE
jgi:hypothetical protein